MYQLFFNSYFLKIEKPLIFIMPLKKKNFNFKNSFIENFSMKKPLVTKIEFNSSLKFVQKKICLQKLMHINY